MRLLWITENYYPGRGGMAQSCDRIVQSLRSCGIAIDLVHFTGAALATPRIEMQSGGRYIAWPVGEGVAHALNCLWNWLEADALRSELTHVVAFGGSLPMQASPVFAAWLGVPLITLIRGNDFDAAVFSPRRAETLRDAILRAARVCAVTREKSGKIAALYPDARPVWTPNGIDLADWTPLPSHVEKARIWRQDNVADGRRVLGLIGHIKQKKGGLFFIESLIASGCAERLHLLLVGEIAPEVMARLAEPDAVAYTAVPFGDRYNLLSWYPACDLVVLPSFYDGLPNVLLEAAALGIPLLASRVGGMNDVLEDGVSGILFDPGDSDACRRAVARAVAADLVPMGEAARAAVHARFTHTMEADRYVAILQETAAEAARRTVRQWDMA